MLRPPGMHLGNVIFISARLLLLFGVAQLFPVLVGWWMGDPPAELAALLAAALASLSVGALGSRYGVLDPDHIGTREGFGVVSAAWFLMAVFGGLAYMASPQLHASATDAFFEAMSGLTTTGASVFSQLETMPRGLMFWRCMSQWIGGMGIVVLSVALLPMLGVGGYRLLKAETPGGMAFERDAPRIKETATSLWQIYSALTLVLAVLLWSNGMSVYDAVCHAMTTLSTGGFSTQSASISAYASGWIHLWICVFMFLAGANFVLYPMLLRGDLRGVLAHRELRFYAVIVAGSTLLLVWHLSEGWMWDAPLWRNALFQVLTVMTTTGFATVDFDGWPELARLLLLTLMFVGGCMGSTAGGIKVARLSIYVRTIGRELRRLVTPRAVLPMRVGDRVLSESVVSNVSAFVVLYLLLFAIGVWAMVGADYDLVTALSASVAAISNIGPGLGEVGPTQDWGHLPAALKWLFALLMMLGRLEIYSVLVLLTPGVWRR